MQEEEESTHRTLWSTNHQGRDGFLNYEISFGTPNQAVSLAIFAAGGRQGNTIVVDRANKYEDQSFC